MNHFDEASFLGQHDISTKTTFFGISNEQGGIIKSSISIDFLKKLLNHTIDEPKWIVSIKKIMFSFSDFIS